MVPSGDKRINLSVGDRNMQILHALSNWRPTAVSLLITHNSWTRKTANGRDSGLGVAAQIEQQMPILNDAEATRYVQQVGARLVRAIPSQFQQPAFAI